MKGEKMADYAWVDLRIWPWENEWLDHDDELRQAFDDVGLFREGSLDCPTEGEIDFHADDKGPVPFRVAVLNGEMKGGSYEIREESTILECLKERNIAFFLSGDAKYDWDGDETWWHPGRNETFSSTAGETGRFLNKWDFDSLKARCLPVADRVALVNAHIRTCQENIEKIEAEDRNRVAEGKPTIGHYSLPTWREAIARHENERDRLLTEMPDPEDLGELVTEFFAADPFAWRPDETWEPKLKTDVEAEV
jgi:hypothetical protein